MEFHREQLAKHCRVCGKRLSKAKGRETYSCSDYPAQLMACFGINVHRDTDTLHPPQFCNPCYANTEIN